MLGPDSFNIRNLAHKANTLVESQPRRQPAQTLFHGPGTDKRERDRTSFPGIGGQNVKQ